MTSSYNNDPYGAFFPSQKDPLLGLVKPVTMDHSFASQKSLAGLSTPKTPYERAESFAESLRQGNPRDGTYQVIGQHSGALGETVVTGGIDSATRKPAFSVAHGSDQVKLKYRERLGDSAVFVERKTEISLGTAYCEGSLLVTQYVCWTVVNSAKPGGEILTSRDLAPRIHLLRIPTRINSFSNCGIFHPETCHCPTNSFAPPSDSLRPEPLPQSQKLSYLFE